SGSLAPGYLHPTGSAARETPNRAGAKLQSGASFVAAARGQRRLQVGGRRGLLLRGVTLLDSPRLLCPQPPMPGESAAFLGHRNWCIALKSGKLVGRHERVGARRRVKLSEAEIGLLTCRTQIAKSAASFDEIDVLILAQVDAGRIRARSIGVGAMQVEHT